MNSKEGNDNKSESDSVIICSDDDDDDSSKAESVVISFDDEAPKANEPNSLSSVDKANDCEATKSLEDEMLKREEYKGRLKALITEHFEMEQHFLSRQEKPSFTEREKRIMLYYLIAHNSILRAKGLQVWEAMNREEILPHRTPYSLWNHFQKFLLPHIDRFHLPEIFVEDFKQLLRKKERNK